MYEVERLAEYAYSSHGVSGDVRIRQPKANVRTGHSWLPNCSSAAPLWVVRPPRSCCLSLLSPLFWSASVLTIGHVSAYVCMYTSTIPAVSPQQLAAWLPRSFLPQLPAPLVDGRGRRSV